MDRKLPDGLLEDLNAYISTFTGLYFSETRLADLERGISRAAADFGFASEAAFIGWLKSRPLEKKQIERLAAHLTVGETYFFRDPSTFDALERTVLPGLLEARHEHKRIRVWSAGCSTGEEPYSIAMLLDRVVPDIKSWNISILATDINAVSLGKASEGVYRQWSFRNTPEWIRRKYFTALGDGAFRIAPGIRKMVSFGYLNLAEDVYPSLLSGTNGVDIILCRNVLMYLSDSVASSVVTGFQRALVDDGWLLVAPAEAVRAVSGVFVPVNVGETIFYRKASAAPEPPVRKFIPPPAAEEPLPEKTPGPEPVARETEPVSPLPVAGPDPLEAAEGLYSRGLYREAAAMLEALDDEARGEQGTLLIAKSCANMGLLEDASMWCEKAMAGNPLNKGACMLLATVRLEQARADEAMDNLRKALYIDQDFVIAHFMLGKLLMEKGGGREAAMRHFDAAYRLLEPEKEDAVVPESDGVMAGRLREILASTLKAASDV